MYNSPPENYEAGLFSEIFKIELHDNGDDGEPADFAGIPHGRKQMSRDSHADGK